MGAHFMGGKGYTEGRILKARMADLLTSIDPADEDFVLFRQHVELLTATVGAEVLVDRGLM